MNRARLRRFYDLFLVNRSVGKTLDGCGFIAIVFSMRMFCIIFFYLTVCPLSGRVGRGNLGNQY